MRSTRTATHKITVRVTTEELKSLKKNALRFAQGNMSDYLRQSILREFRHTEENMSRYLIFTH